jgi:IS5 family transposase
MSFLGFPNPIPDSRTIWLFKERMAKTGKDKMIWAGLQRQLDAMGCALSTERFKIPHSLRQILDHQRNYAARRLRLAAAEMKLG